MKNLTDRRSSIRKPFKQIVSFEMRAAETGRYANVMAQGEGIDLAPGGIGIRTEKQLERGDVVKLFLPVTEEETEVPVFSQVMWSTRKGGKCRTGLRFLR